MEIVKNAEMALNPELAEMTKQKGVGHQMLKAKFNELYADLEDNEQLSMKVAMYCYLLHHRRHKYRAPYTAGIACNPLLTLVSDEIGAISRKYHIAPLNGVTGPDGRTLKLMLLVKGEGATDKDKKKQRKRRRMISTRGETVYMTDKIHQLFMPSYGIFQDGELDLSEKNTVMEVICKHDAVDVLGMLLKDDALDTPEMLSAMLATAKKFDAVACRTELKRRQRKYQHLLKSHHPLFSVDQLIRQAFTICTPTAFNAFYVLESIQKRFVRAVRLVENYTHRFQDLKHELDLAKKRIRGVSVEGFEKEDLQLFAQATVLMLDILVAAQQSGYQVARGDEATEATSTLSDLIGYIVHSLNNLLISVDESKVRFVMAWLNKIAKLLFQLNPQIALSTLHEFSFISVQKFRKASPQLVLLYAEFLRLCIRYGYSKTRLVLDIVLACDCDGPILEAIQLHAQLLPRTSLQVYRDGKEGWRTFVDDCVQEGNVKKTAEVLARNDKVLQRIDTIYERKTVPSLQVLCRSKLYNMLPTAKLQALVDDVAIPKPVREFLALDTMSLEYDAIRFK